MMRPYARGLCWIFSLALLIAIALGCGDDTEPVCSGVPEDVETREPCADRNALRNLYFGDLHVHTAYSFDVYVFDVRVTPEQAYRFARGEPLALPPLDAEGQGTQILRLDRPLDFAAVTDHSEFLGEVEICTTPGSVAFDSDTCQLFRAHGARAQASLGVLTTLSSPRRSEDICGADGDACLTQAGEVWRRTLEAADAAYDRSARCAFTTFAAYEYTANTGASTQHRNVIFRNMHVPFPISYFEQPTPHGLRAELKATCLDADDGCDVLAIPHNSNESNGKMFLVEHPGAEADEERRARAALRAALEPVAEIYQHKGDSECVNGLSGILGEPDELCDFEKRRQAPFDDCGDGIGSGGAGGRGCISRRDFLRGALLAGLREAERLDVNPLRLGFIASTDTHNGTPGATEEEDFIGHRGIEDAGILDRLGSNTRRSGSTFSPGGLAAVWAEENSRASIFDALRRREVFGTSGPRIAVRFFAGWDFDRALCDDSNMIETADATGVPMGAVLPPPPEEATAPRFVLSALRDPGTPRRPGTLLQRLQVIKGWLDDGQAHQRVFNVAGDPNNGATVDEVTCVPEGPGYDSLCAVWTDPNFSPDQRAFYYARVVENPSCRWTAYTCNTLAPDQRPPACSDPAVSTVVQERAWTSPVWYDP